MFTALISSLTDAEIAADISTCRAVLKAGEVNGIPLDSDCEADYRGWLADLVEEQNIRSNPADYETVVSVRRAA